MNEQSRKIELEISRLKNLPALPEASIKILDAINNPNIPIDKLSEVLSLSPGLVARLLGLANSAYFGKSRGITDLRTAIFQVLGLDLVKSLALGVVVNVQFDTSKCINFNTEYFWSRSLVTAVAAQRLAMRHSADELSPATVYNCGLLLYIGMLVIAFLLPDELNAIFFCCSQPGQLKVGEELHRRLGWSHFQMGYQLMRKWQLSPIYQQFLQHYDDPDVTGEVAVLQRIMKVAQQISAGVVKAEEPTAELFDKLAADSGIALDVIAEIFGDLYEKRENIQQLAQIMGG